MYTCTVSTMCGVRHHYGQRDFRVRPPGCVCRFGSSSNEGVARVKYIVISVEREWLFPSRGRVYVYCQQHYAPSLQRHECVNGDHIRPRVLICTTVSMFCM